MDWMILSRDGLFFEWLLTSDFVDKFGEGVTEGVVATVAVRSKFTIQGVKKLSADMFVARALFSVSIAVRRVRNLCCVETELCGNGVMVIGEWCDVAYWSVKPGTCPCAASRQGHAHGWCRECDGVYARGL